MYLIYILIYTLYTYMYLTYILIYTLYTYMYLNIHVSNIHTYIYMYRSVAEAGLSKFLSSEEGEELLRYITGK